MSLAYSHTLVAVQALLSNKACMISPNVAMSAPSGSCKEMQSIAFPSFCLGATQQHSSESAVSSLDIVGECALNLSMRGRVD